MPSAALLSIHARVADTQPDTIYDPSLIQIWGPRYSAFVVAAQDVAPFTLGRLPDDEKGRQRAESAAQRLRAAIGSKKVGHHDVGEQMGVNPEFAEIRDGDRRDRDPLGRRATTHHLDAAATGCFICGRSR